MVAERESIPPYGSAYDLPSIAELRQQIAGAKVLTRFVARDKRASILRIEKEMQEMLGLADAFYSVLGSRNWILTDNLPIAELRDVLRPGVSGHEAELAVIEVIGNRVRSDFWFVGFVKNEALRVRRRQLERARAHYLAGHWDSCALTLVTVMDGFVNDVQPSERRGLHAREASEMVAWDSLVGHHKGLSSVMPTFLKSFRRREEQEVFEVYRHGFVHGNVLSYDNVIVATKAWNMLSAVADWATSLEKAEAPKPPQPGLKEVLAKFADFSADRRYRDQFVPFRISSSDPSFDQNPAVSHIDGFLDAWRLKRWAIVAESIPASVLRSCRTPGQRAARAKSIYSQLDLTDYRIDEVIFPQASVAVAHGEATMDGQRVPVEIRWIEERADGGLARSGDDGARWMLAVWPPGSFIKDVDE